MTKITWSILTSILLMMLSPANAQQQNVVTCRPDQNIAWISNTSLLGTRELDGFSFNQLPPYSSPWETSETSAPLVFVPIKAEEYLSGIISVNPSNITHRIAGSAIWVTPRISCSIGASGRGEIYGACYQSIGEITHKVIEIWQADLRSQIEYIYRSPELNVPIFGLAIDAPKTILEYGRCERL